MKRTLLSWIAPPVAVCRYGCAGCCAAPIAVFWLAAIASFVYGFQGGPVNADAISWYTIGLGVILWFLAGMWATITIRSVDEEKCDRKPSPVCRGLDKLDDHDPLDDVRNV